MFNIKKIAMVPYGPTHLKNNIFRPDSPINRDNVAQPFIKLKEISEAEYGYTINTVDITTIKEADYIIFFQLNLKYIVQAWLLGKLANSIYISSEPPVVELLHEPENLKKIGNFFNKIFTWNDDLVDNKKFRKFYFPMPTPSNDKPHVKFDDKKIITMIIGNKQSSHPDELYTERKKAIKAFERILRDKFEFFGAGWDKKDFPSYAGRVENKYDVLRNYKFTICYENQKNIAGLMSEKIFDCFYARTIPVFLGADNVEKYIPADCFVDMRKFGSYEELYQYLSNMEEAEYNKRIKAIDEYLSSNEFKKHLPEGFANNILDIIKTLNENNKVNVTIFDILWLAYKQFASKAKRYIGKVMKNNL